MAAEDERPTITVTESGPYHVTGGLPLRKRRMITTAQDEPVAWQTSEPVETLDDAYLCRCGGSRNKPFCDGTHKERDWDSAETAPTSSYDERAKDYPSSGVTVRDDRGICQHAGFCATKATTVWKMTKAAGDTAVRSQMQAMVERCPSGALTYRVEGEDRDVEPDLPQALATEADGALLVTGGVRVVRADGQPLETRHRMALCRCGASRNKPLCDGSHAGADFQAP